MIIMNDDSNEFVLDFKRLLLIYFDIDPIIFNSKIIIELVNVVRLCFRFVLNCPAYIENVLTINIGFQMNN